MNIIETRDLTKSYADFTAVSGINLHIPKGAVYGFLGPNGAGKSTTMKMFLGLTKPTSGSFTIDGKKYPDNRVQILKEIGSFIEAPAFYGNLSGEENLEIIRKILGLPKSSVAEALEIVGLTQYKKRLAKKYSLGMKQKIYLAGAFMSNAQNIILDEPFNAIDPESTSVIKKILFDLKDTGKMILFSVHNLDLVSNFCDKIIFIDNRHSIFECNNPQNFDVLEKIFFDKCVIKK